MPPRTEHLEPNRLPDENALRIYMESLEIADPYSFPEGITAPFSAAFSSSPDTPIDMRQLLVSDLFPDKNLNPNFIREENELAQEFGNYGLCAQTPVEVVGNWNRCGRNQKDSHYQTISRSGDLGYCTREWQGCLISFKNYQHHQLIRELGRTGHIAKRVDPEIRTEIALRRKQYPNQQIYVFIGHGLSNYFAGVGLKNTIETAPAISVYSSNWNYTEDNGFIESWESAVIAQNQIRSNHSLHYHYEIDRIPRWWRLHWWMYMKFGIEIDPRIDSKDLIREGPTKQTRFSMLDI